MFDATLNQWSYLEGNVKKLWRVEALVSTFFLCLFLGIAEFVLTRSVKKWPLPPMVITGGVFLLFLIISFSIISKRYQLYRYRLGEDDLAVASGVFWRKRRFISRARVQHVDISAGPIMRAFGLVKVQVYVGGQAMPAGEIPGLSAGDAEILRNRMLASGIQPKPAPPAGDAPVA